MTKSSCSSDPRARQAVLAADSPEEAVDLALAMVRRVQREVRPDLRVVVMSATLDAAGVSRLLDDAPVVTSAVTSRNGIRLVPARWNSPPAITSSARPITNGRRVRSSRSRVMSAAAAATSAAATGANIADTQSVNIDMPRALLTGYLG